MITPATLIEEVLEHHDDIGWAMQMLRESNPLLFKEFEKHIQADKHIYQFVSNPFEDTKTLEQKETFRHLKNAVKHREYRKITFQGSTEDNLKCLKLIYMENNWYLAYVNADEKLLLARVGWIKKVEYASNIGKYQPSSVREHHKFLENVQNSMTLYGKPKKIARIKSAPAITKYFHEGMKLFLSSQKFEKILDDGSVIFTLEYTQPMEILPFVRSWLPHMVILEPEELRMHYRQELQMAMEMHQ